MALVAGAAPFAAPAFGQGTPGVVPDPISSADLDKWAARISLSSREREAIAQHHEAYLAEFRALREGETEDLLPQISSLATARFQSTDRATIEAAIRAADRMMSQIRTLDGRFFASVYGVLLPPQLAALPRFMDCRSRSRHATGTTQLIGGINQAASVDLGALCDELGLTETARGASEPIIVDYEGRLTSLVRELHEAATGAFLGFARALEDRPRHRRARGAQLRARDQRPCGEPRRPRAAARRPEAIRSRAGSWWVVRAIASQPRPRPRFEHRPRLVVLNRATLARFRDALGAERAAAVRRAYFRGAFPEVYDEQSAAGRFIDAAGRLEELSAEQAGQIQAIGEAYRAAFESVCERLLNSYIQVSEGGAVTREDRSRIEMLESDRDEVNAKAVRQLRSVLDEGQLARVRLPPLRSGP